MSMEHCWNNGEKRVVVGVGVIEMLKQKPVPIHLFFTRDHTWTCLGSDSGLWREVVV